MILRLDDLDQARCKSEFREALIDDLKWFGLQWSEGPDVQGPCAPYLQSERRALYVAALRKLQAGGHLYPCACSRRDVAGAVAAPHDEDEEPIYPGTCRPSGGIGILPMKGHRLETDAARQVNWRFRVPDKEAMHFVDLRLGNQRGLTGRDFGDFIVWRRDGVPAYQLAVVVDDAVMRVTEVVRGEDLLISTFRQLLIYRALGLEPPAFYHTPLLRGEDGKRLAKRSASLSLGALRRKGVTPEEIRARWIALSECDG